MATRVCNSTGGWAAVAEALNSCRPGDTVRLEAGVYRAQTRLAVPAQVAIEGVNGVQIVHYALGPALSIGNAEVKVSGVKVSGLRFVRGGSDAGLAFVEVMNAENVVIADCAFDGAGVSEAAVAVADSKGARVDTCHARNFARENSFKKYIAAIEFRRSQGDVINCRCSEARAGIFYGSSEGEIRGNECWGNTKSGIAVERDPKSPKEPSRVRVLDNRCHDNTQTGIAFLSSNGLARNNECWGNTLSGIAVVRDTNCTREPSRVRVVDNRCHDNTQCGILFGSSNGLARNNECWGNTFSGIAVQRDTRSTNAPSRVRVLDNRCHDNTNSGVAFFSSNGVARNNECWGNTFSGIAVQRDTRSTNAPSRVRVLDNRCHDNTQCGILFGSSNGLARNNECWGNALSGILVQRDTRSTNAPSRVRVLDNRCHDNTNSGVAFFSSNGVARNNECWGNTLSGIEVTRDDKSTKAPSKGLLLANRCHHNDRGGITVFSSEGTLEDNECWGNLRSDEVERVDNPKVDLRSHFTKPSMDVIELRRQWRLQQPLGGWRARHSDASLPTPAVEGLADFIAAGGGVSRFAMFWNQGRVAEQAIEPAKPAAHVRAYRVQRTEAGSSAEPISQNDKIWKPARPPREGPAALIALLPRFGQQWQGRVERKKNRDGERLRAPRWVVAFASADEPAFDDRWCSAAAEVQTAADMACGVTDDKRRLHPIIHRFDLIAHRTDGELMQLIEKELLPTRLGKRIFDAVASPFLTPARTWLPMGILAAVGLWLYGKLIGVSFASIPGVGGDWSDRLAQQPWQALAEPWTQAVLPLLAAYRTAMFSKDSWKSLATIAIMAFLIWELHVPSIRVIRLQGKFLEALTALIESFDINATRLKLIKGPVLWLQQRGLLSSRNAWLRRHLYGRRLFPRVWGSHRAPPVVMVLRNVDLLGKQDAKALRRIIALCPQYQAVLILTQMPALSMLPGGFLDVWYAPEELSIWQAWQASAFWKRVGEPISNRMRSWFRWHSRGDYEGFVVHDPRSVSIPVAEEKLENGNGFRNLGKILGLSDEKSSEPDQKSREDDELSRWINPLRNKTWTQTKLLAALVLGSTPYAYARFVRPIDKPLNQRDLFDVNQNIRRYSDTFGDEDQPLTDGDLDRLDQHCANADALQAVRNQDVYEWIGRCGYRRQLAQGLRELYRKPGANPDRYVCPADGNLELGRFMICGEINSLETVIDFFEKLPKMTPEMRERTPKLVALWLDSAVHLASEARELAPGLRGRAATLKECWHSVLTKFCREPAPVALKSQVSRLGPLLLKASELSEISPQEAPWPKAPVVEWERLLYRNPGTSEESATIWDLFLDEAATFMRSLAVFDPASAAIWLEAKLAQDWAALPKTYQDHSRKQLKDLPLVCMERLAEAGSRDSQFGSRQRSPHAMKIPDLSLFDLYFAAAWFSHRPAVVLAGLAMLAGEYVRQRDRKLAIREQGWEQICDALRRLQPMLHEDTVPDALPTVRATPGAPSLAAAWKLLTDAAELNKLGGLLAEGLKDREPLRQAAQQARNDIEGVALGVHGKLYGQKTRIEEQIKGRAEEEMEALVEDFFLR